MTMNLKLVASIFICTVIILILHYIKKKKINVKYSATWLILFSILFIFLIIPGFLEKMTKLLGFTISSNMIFSLLIGVLVIINITFTAILSSQDRKIRLLIQEISILKRKKDEK